MTDERNIKVQEEDAAEFEEEDRPEDGAVAAAARALGYEGEGDQGGSGEDGDAGSSGGEASGGGQDPVDLLARASGMSREEVEQVVAALRQRALLAEQRAASEPREEERGRDVQGKVELPPDLAEEVESGLIDEERAREIVQLRERVRQFEQLSRHYAIQQAAYALSVWEHRMESDPVFSSAKDVMVEYVKQNVAPLVRAGVIGPNEAVAMVEEEFQRLKKVAKGRKTPKPVEGQGGSSSRRDSDAMLLEKVAAILSGRG